jgi:hypothetical protein
MKWRMVKKNAAAYTSIEAVRTEIASYAMPHGTLAGLFGDERGYCILLDEADHIPAKAQAALRGMMEEAAGSRNRTCRADHSSPASDDFLLNWKSCTATNSLEKESFEFSTAALNDFFFSYQRTKGRRHRRHFPIFFSYRLSPGFFIYRRRIRKNPSMPSIPSD